MTESYFSDAELSCKCGCGQNKFDSDFLRLLNHIRRELGSPLIVTSAYRCPDHPIEKAKTKAGAHTTGKAIDLAVAHQKAHALLTIALDIGIERIGVAQKGDLSKRFIHLDVCTEKDGFIAPTIWSY